MPRTHQRQLGSRPYANFDRGRLQEALNAVRAGTDTLRRIVEEYGIPRSTLSRYKNGKNIGKYGRPPVFSEEEEKILVKCISLAGDWGLPLTKCDICCIVKAHLNRKGIRVPRFSNNTPGPDWIESFLKRNSGGLTTRLCQNIKRSRAAVDETVINEYFDHLETTLCDVEPALIVNYDETNITDDPKRQRVIVRRKCRHPERIIDGSKSSTSVMFAAAGDGHLLPPYVNYKAEHLYSTWTTGGPSGTVYNRTKSGWFTLEIFEDWFRSIALPYFKKFDKQKKKVLIGDNLASHVSPWIIEQCEQENIQFVLLPPNSTGLCQPLDVAYFKPLKSKWSEVLTTWKIKHRGTVPKDTFPRLLKQCLDKLNDKNLENIRAGFMGSGLIPLDRQQVLKRMPKQISSIDTQDVAMEWAESFKEFLRDSRFKETQALKPRRKKLNVAPGKGITESDIDRTSTSTGQKGRARNRKSETTKRTISETDTDATISIHDDSSLADHYSEPNFDVDEELFGEIDRVQDELMQADPANDPLSDTLSDATLNPFLYNDRQRQEPSKNTVTETTSSPKYCDQNDTTFAVGSIVIVRWKYVR